MVLRDLRTQLEIANAQRAEFEEAAAVLRQEVTDAAEERRIVDRKAAAATKDLRRQLAAEKTRSDRLQERLRDCSFDMGSPVSTGKLRNDIL